MWFSEVVGSSTYKRGHIVSDRFCHVYIVPRLAPRFCHVDKIILIIDS